MPLSYFLRAASRLRSASSWPFAAASICRLAVSITRCALRTFEDDVLLEDRQRGLLDVSRLNCATPRAPLRRAVEDRVGEDEPTRQFLKFSLKSWSAASHQFVFDERPAAAGRAARFGSVDEGLPDRPFLP